MKNWTFLLCILWTLLACTSELEVEIVEQQASSLTLRMGVTGIEPVHPVSRQVSDPLGTKDYPPLWAVVFDGTGYLVEYARARNFERQGEVVTFDVTLRTTSQKRIVHLLLNYEDDLSLHFGHESSVIGELVTTDGRGACWQRLVFEDGIHADMSKTRIQRIPLVRNYARIRVVNDAATHFELTGFYVLRVPGRGRVAPYHNGKFVDYLDASGTQAKDYAALVGGEGYVGAMPADAGWMHQPGDVVSAKDWVPEGETYSLYEYTHKDNPETTLSVMLRGRYRGGEETYYKVDLVDQQAERAVYYHLLRNFTYEVHVQKVVGDGETSFLEACLGLSSNNLSSSTLVKKVLNVSDGTSSLRVAYTDTTLVSTDAVQLRYRYVPDLRNPGKTRNEAVVAEWLPGPDGTLFDVQVESRPAGDGWATLILRPLALPPYPKTQTLLVYSTENRLSREVRFTLRPAMDLQLHCSPKKMSEVKGESVWVDILLPDRLNETLFPLQFLIEAQRKGNSVFLQNTLSPHRDEVMAVVTGPSIVEGFENEPSIQFLKSLTYDDYLALPKGEDGVAHRLSCHFVTNTNQSGARVYVHNRYFVKATDDFGTASSGGF